MSVRFDSSANVCDKLVLAAWTSAWTAKLTVDVGACSPMCTVTPLVLGILVREPCKAVAYLCAFAMFFDLSIPIPIEGVLRELIGRMSTEKIDNTKKGTW